MIEILKEFIHSQLFGIILGAFLTGVFTLLCDLFRSIRDEKSYIKRRREVLYQKMYDFSMRFEKDIRAQRLLKMSQETKDCWNEIQIESIFGKHSTMEAFYDLYQDLQDNLNLSPNILKVHQENNKRILEFYTLIKNELGIKD